MVLHILIFGPLYLHIKRNFSFPLQSTNEEIEVYYTLVKFQLFLSKPLLTFHLKGRSLRGFENRGAEGNT
jgi:hypothetical protein